MKCGHVFAIAFVALSSMSCITVPRQTVTLSETVQEQTASLQTAHEELVSRYYSELRHRVEVFIEERWIPMFLSKAVDDPAVQKQVDDALGTAHLSAAAIVGKIEATGSLSPAENSVVTSAVNNSVIGGKAQFGTVMIRFSGAVLKQIDQKRSALMAPIDEQEQLVLSRLRTAYANLQSEEAAIKAFLNSAANVQQEQDAILQKMGLLNEAQTAIHTAASASSEASQLLATEENAEAFVARMKQANEQLKTTPPPAAANSKTGGHS